MTKNTQLGNIINPNIRYFVRYSRRPKVFELNDADWVHLVLFQVSHFAKVSEEPNMGVLLEDTKTALPRQCQ